MTSRRRFALAQCAALPLGAGAAAVLLALRGEHGGVLAASVLCLLALPWVVAALIALAVLSAPVYMALHPLGAAPALDAWLGAVVLLAIAVGVQINAGLLLAWLRRPRAAPDPGIGEFLRRRAGHRDDVQ